MKKFCQYLVVLAVLLSFGGSAWAFNAADHVTLSGTNTGDLLYYKYYVVANGGWQTKISVTNTNTAASVVCKLVVRSWVNSTELLDFLIYLSPGDMWNGYLYWNETAQKTYIYSEDGSCLNNTGSAFASAADPLDYPLQTIGTGKMAFCPAQDSTSAGYIYIVKAAQVTTAPAAGSSATDFTVPGVSKTAMQTEYKKGSAGQFETWTQAFANEHEWINPITGYQVFNHEVSGISAGDVPVFLKDYKCITYLATNETNRIGADDSNNSLGEVEAVLAKVNVSMPYVDDADRVSVHIMGFPTKYTTSTACVVSAYEFAGPFFDQHITGTDATLHVSDVVVWDVDEHFASNPFSPAPKGQAYFRNEVEIYAVSDLNGQGYPEGWVEYPMVYTPTITETKGLNALTYTGAPMTTSVVTFVKAGMWAIGQAGGWTAPEIKVDTVPLPNYQVAEEAGS